MQSVALVAWPSQLWVSVAIAAALGVGALVIAHRQKHAFVREIVRDLGIAFIVAAVVSAVYEYSTRNIEKHESDTKMINRIMSFFAPDVVWAEVRDQILRRGALRRNVQIELAVSRNKVLNGRTVNLPPGQAVMWMKYSYDLYNLTGVEALVPVRHELETSLEDQAARLPRFERLTVMGPESEARLYEGTDLDKLSDGHGAIELLGAQRVHLPPSELKQPVQILTERYEIVHTPGFYYLIVPELTVPEEQGTEPTIRVTINELPDDLEPDVTTYYGTQHDFVRPDPTKNVWIFKKTLLPGQGLTVVFRSRKK
jgi:hypothetical protein